LERAFTILRTFLTAEEELAAAEIGKRAGLDPSTTFRMLVALEDEGLVERDPSTGKYGLGIGCLELGSKFIERNNLRTLALRALESLRDEYGETAHLCVLDGAEIVYVEKLAGLHPIGLLSSHVGGRAPAHCTGVGKVLLAFLPEGELARRFPRHRLERYTESTITDMRTLRAELEDIRNNGYAVDRQEHELGVKCVAAAIFDPKRAVAAVSVSGPIERMDEHIARGNLLARVRQTAAEISRQLGLGRGIGQFAPYQEVVAFRERADNGRGRGVKPHVYNAAHRKL
jgi:DNA-binding IclR family transcriptional regulator